MTRFEDWPLRLSSFLESQIAKPFQWGTTDCMIFCCDAILEMTGVDQAYNIRGTYNTKEGADEVISGFGDDVEAIIDARIGQRKPIGKAMRGDVVTYEFEGVICGGIVDDTGRRAAFMTESGLTRIPLKLCRAAWTV